MSDTFKIRKNKSQKEIYPCELARKSPLLGQPQKSKGKNGAHPYSYKVAHLEPLLKTKGSIQQSTDRTADIRLDFTLPMPHKSSSLNKHEARNEGLHLMPLDINLPARPVQADK
jgi:hypothetical protein